MIGNVGWHNMMPDQIYSKNNCTADNSAKSKVLFFDIVQQSQGTAGISSVDADVSARSSKLPVGERCAPARQQSS